MSTQACKSALEAIILKWSFLKLRSQSNGWNQSLSDIDVYITIWQMFAKWQYTIKLDSRTLQSNIIIWSYNRDTFSVKYTVIFNYFISFKSWNHNRTCRYLLEVTVGTHCSSLVLQQPEHRCTSTQGGHNRKLALRRSSMDLVTSITSVRTLHAACCAGCASPGRGGEGERKG